MGALEELEAGRRRALGPRCVIGRHASCDLRFDDARISAEHALLRWLDGRWELRDLGSRNGTLVGDHRLVAGERVTLDRGSVVTLGGTRLGFVLVDASCPRASARHTESGEIRAADDGMLVLPSEARSVVTIYEDAAGRWMAEREHATEPVADSDVLVVDGEAWLLELPSGMSATVENAAGIALDVVELRFAVSRDEEHVEVTLAIGDRAIPVAPRSYHYLLLTLARIWLKDELSPPGDRGWVDRKTLCRMLATDELKLNVDICRARKQFSALGIYGAAAIIARRPGTSQLRIGIDRIAVTST
ncbi:FHA domain-containing protein [Sorangium atrum]|uniref:FHA domain-containing protein n=1 Tax=Sorangium atrum TaxID=2995308 RepID=A0ABT5BYD1_9BACT|nr:FHA domain-containing protein [Sorangium aterium]MDC0678443.1 FHA domain-containing protein [Sorangium aterium]